VAFPQAVTDVLAAGVGVSNVLGLWVDAVNSVFSTSSAAHETKSVGTAQLVVAALGLCVVAVGLCFSSAPTTCVGARVAHIATAVSLATTASWIGIGAWAAVELRDEWARRDGWWRAWYIASVAVMATAALDHLIFAYALCRAHGAKRDTSDTKRQQSSQPGREHPGTDESL